jgi:BNR repeat-like domain
MVRLVLQAKILNKSARAQLKRFMSLKIRGVLYMLLGLFVSMTFVPAALTASPPTSPAVTFGTITNLSNDSASSIEPVIAAVGSHVYVAWEDKANGRPQVFFVESSNKGASWSPIKEFNGLTGGATAVQIAATGNNAYLTWKQNGQAAFSASHNFGVTWGSPLVFNLENGTVSEPAFATNGTSVYVAWQFDSNINSSTYAVIAISHNNGTTFSPLKDINDGLRVRELQIAAEGKYVYVTWDSIYVTSSSDGGNSFSVPMQVEEPDCSYLTHCISREPMITASGPDVYVAFPSSFNGVYEAYMAISTNHGMTFTTKNVTSPVNVVSVRETQVGSCAGSNDQVPCTGTSNVYLTFRANGSAGGAVNQYFVKSSDNGSTFSRPVDLAVQKKGQAGFGGLSVMGSNVFVEWVHKPAKSSIAQMYLQTSTDGGVTWQGAQQVSQSTSGVIGMADSNTMHDQGPLSATGANHIYLVWYDVSGDVYFAAGTVT